MYQKSAGQRQRQRRRQRQRHRAWRACFDLLVHLELRCVADMATARVDRSLAIFGVACGPRARCGLVRWCQQASRLRSALGPVGLQSTVVVLTDDSDEYVQADCANATVVRVDARLDAAARHCYSSLQGSLREQWSWHRLGGAHSVHYKWQAHALTRYELVLVLDMDVLVMPQSIQVRKVQQRWALMAPQLLGAVANVNGTRVLAHPDVTGSPFHGGLVLLRPDIATYQAGLDVLERCRMNSTHGWELVGPPHRLTIPAPRHLDGSLAAHVGNRWKRDWRFTGAAVDQGHWYYMLYVRTDHGRYFRVGSNRHHPALHFLFREKLWMFRTTTRVPLPPPAPTTRAGHAPRGNGRGINPPASTTSTSRQAAAVTPAMATMATTGVARLAYPLDSHLRQEPTISDSWLARLAVYLDESHFGALPPAHPARSWSASHPVVHVETPGSISSMRGEAAPATHCIEHLHELLSAVRADPRYPQISSGALAAALWNRSRSRVLPSYMHFPMW